MRAWVNALGPMLNVCFWPIATFRFSAEFGRNPGHRGLWQADRLAVLWVHGLVGRGSLRFYCVVPKYLDSNASQVVFMHSLGSNRPPLFSRSKTCRSKAVRSLVDILPPKVSAWIAAVNFSLLLSWSLIIRIGARALDSLRNTERAHLNKSCPKSCLLPANRSRVILKRRRRSCTDAPAGAITSIIHAAKHEFAVSQCSRDQSSTLDR